MKTGHIALAALAVTALVSTSAPALARQAASPAGQVVQAGEPNEFVVYRYRFREDGTISVDIPSVYPPLFNGPGTWSQAADGSVTITGSDFAATNGDGEVICETWPDWPVGYETTEVPCWWNGPDPDGPFRRVE